LIHVNEAEPRRSCCAILARRHPAGGGRVD
jgi:hypothetical protein